MKRGILIILLILIGGGAWYWYKTKNTQPGTSQPTRLFFPTGDSTGGVSTNDTTLSDPTTTPISVSPTIPSDFIQISPGAIAGYSAFSLTTTTTVPGSTPKSKPIKQTTVTPVVRYVSRINGYVYEIKKGDTPTQITNIYIPNIYEAFFADNGKTAILRFLREDRKTIATYSVPIADQNQDGSRTQKNGTYLPDNITTVSSSPDGFSIARITTEASTAVISTTNTINTSRKELLRSPFHEWLISWSLPKDVYLQTKASGTTEGFFYKIDQTKGRLVRILGNIPGLTTSISPNGTYILYSESTKNGFTTKIITTKTGVVKPLGYSILPEKCAWLKNEDLICAGASAYQSGIYPDDWYSGISHFKDKLLHIYTGTNIVDTLASPSDEQSFDMTNLQIDETKRVLYFIDKSTGILWQFTL